MQAKAKLYAQDHGAHYLAFGGESEEALEAIAAAARATGLSPATVWSAAGSGVLTRGLQRGFPAAAFCAVQVGRAVDKPGRATLFQSGQKFEAELIDPAQPFPACPNYDAKAWKVCRAAEGTGRLFWNVLGPSPTPFCPA